MNYLKLFQGCRHPHDECCLHSLKQEHRRSLTAIRRTATLPASLPLAIMLVATSLIVDCEGPEEVMVVTRQALSESQ